MVVLLAAAYGIAKGGTGITKAWIINNRRIVSQVSSTMLLKRKTDGGYC